MAISMSDKWQQVVNEVALAETTSLSDKGSLVVVGSGIMCVAHFTLQAMTHIKHADKVFYLVSDPVTEVYIQELRPDAIDLFVLYDENKVRYTTYAQITDVLLHYTRRGQKVVVVFYGHPGYLVNPSHEALKIAKSEGLSAVELPAISSLDTMISELGFEPGIPGLQVLEATDLLIYSRKLVTDTHVVINQVGCIGDVTFHYKGFPNQHLPVLIEHLMHHYGDNHVVYNYIGSQFPVCKSVIQKFKLVDLMKPENVANIKPISTLYVPPLNKGKLNEGIARRIGMIKESHTKDTTTMLGHTDETKTHGTCGTRFSKDWRIPTDYKPIKPSALSKLLIEISNAPYGFETVECNWNSLTEYQAKALKTGNSAWVDFALKSDESEIKNEMSRLKCSTNVSSDQEYSPPTTTRNVIVVIMGAPFVQEDGPLNTAAKPLINLSDQVDSLPNTAKPAIASSDQVDSPPNTAKPVIASSDQVDGPLNTAKPLINLSDQVDGLPNTAKSVIALSDQV